MNYLQEYKLSKMNNILEDLRKLRESFTSGKLAEPEAIQEKKVINELLINLLTDKNGY